MYKPRPHPTPLKLPIQMDHQEATLHNTAFQWQRVCAPI